MEEHLESGLVVTNQKAFEAYLEENNPPAHKAYLGIKAEARRKGEDPIVHLLGKLSEKMPERAEQLRAVCISKRLMDPTDYDIAMLRTELGSKGFDVDKFTDLIPDKRKVADLVVALNIERFKHFGESGVYLIIDKILSKKSAKGTGGSPGVIIGSIPPELLVGNEVAVKLLEKYVVDSYLDRFQKDFEGAEAEVENAIVTSSVGLRTSILEKTLTYYRELNGYSPPGIVETVLDEETGQTVKFPALHQKIAGRFIADERKVLLADGVGLGKTAEAIIAKNMIESTNGKVTAVAVVPNEVVDHWERQIDKWNKEKKKVVVIRSSNKAEALAEIEREKPDFIVVSYDMVFRTTNGNGETIGERLAKVADYAIFDEVDEAKSEGALRTKQILQIAENARYVAMLSATPLPNSLADLAVIGHIVSNGEIDIKNFRTQIRKNPRLARVLISSKMLRRDQAEVYGVRDIVKQVVPVPLTHEQMLEHERLLINEAGKGSLALIDSLRRVCLDPKFAGVDMPSPKYEELIRIIKRHVADDEGKGIRDTKVVIYACDLQENVTESLTGLLNANGISAVRVDGQVQGKARDDALYEFKKGSAMALVATLKTMGKGVELKEGNIAVFLNPPLTGAEIEQGIGREARKGQRKRVWAYIMVGKDTREEKILEVAEQKERLQQFVMDGIQLTDEEMKELEKPVGIVKGTKDALSTLYRIFGNITNRSSSLIAKILSDAQVGRYVAEKYWDNFEGSYFGNTNRLLAHIIDELGKTGIETGRIADIASGPGCLARVLQKPVVCSDINKQALVLAREKLGDLVKPVCSTFCALPLAKESFDVTVLSLALLHSLASEREGIIREMSRATKIGGVAIITLPNTYSGFERMIEGCRKLGFEVLGDLTGVAKSPGTSYECFVITLVKVRDASEETLDPSYFELKREVESAGHGGEEFGHIRDVDCESFVIEKQEIKVAAKAAAREKKELLDVRTYQELMARYGSINRIPKPELDALGLEVVEVGRGKNKAFQIREKVDAEGRGRKVAREMAGGLDGGKPKGKVPT